MPYATIRNLTGLSWAVPRLNVILPPGGVQTVYLEDADGFLGDARITAEIEEGRISVSVSSTDPGGAVQADEVGLDTSGFSGNLGPADTNLQLMAATVDALVLGGGIAAPDNVAIYRPSEPSPADNVYATWAAAHAALAGLTGERRLVLDDTLSSSFTVDAATYDMDGIVVEGYRSVAAHGTRTLTVPEGAQLTGNLTLRRVEIDCTATATIPMTGFGARSLILEDNSWIYCSGSVPFIGIGNLTTMFLIIRDRSGIINGSDQVVHVSSASGTLSLDCRDRAYVDDDTISGVGGSTLNIRVDNPASYISKTQPSFAGNTTWQVNFEAGGYSQISKPYTTLTASDHIVDVGDYFLAVNIGAANDIWLYSAARYGAGYEIVVADVSGAAAANPTTVNAFGAETINGIGTYVINTNYGSKKFVSDGVNAWSAV